MDLKKYVFDKAIEARAGARALAKASSKQKNEALVRMAETLKKRAKELISANKRDVQYAKEYIYKCS